MTRTDRIAVVGAGLAGLSAARELASRGFEVVLFDKARGPGGRASTRRAAPWTFDHGAQYFTVRDHRFAAVVEGWRQEDVVAPWSGRVVALGAEGVGGVGGVRGSTERLVGVPGMSAMAKHMARELDVRQAVRIAPVRHDGSAWMLEDEEGSALGRFERLLVSAPPQQAAALLGASTPLAARAAGLVLRPCVAVLLAFREPYGVPFDGAFCEGSALSWIARDSSKPGRPAGDAWVLHGAPDWSAAHFADEATSLVAQLAAQLEQLTGQALPEIAHRDVHRWRYALPDPAAEVGFLFDPERRVALAGDAYHGGRVEGAFLSGLAAAEQLAG